MLTQHPHRKSRVVAILGPTASGKSDLAVALARRWNGEVVSADSRQVYRGLDIGSGKITKREMRGVPHHLLDVASPRQAFSVVRYQTLARRAIAEILRRGKLPIVCGGTGLYVSALLGETLFPAVKPNQALRKKLDRLTTEKLFSELQRRDPRRAATIDRRNRRRLIRALEIIKATDKPVPPIAARKNATGARYKIIKIGIAFPPEKLRTRIKRRLASWLRNGLVGEVRRLHETGGVPWKRFDEFGLHYRSVARHLRREITKQEMIAEAERELWRYVKRQKQWWKRDAAIHWVQKEKEAEKFVRAFLQNGSLSF